METLGRYSNLELMFQRTERYRTGWGSWRDPGASRAQAGVLGLEEATGVKGGAHKVQMLVKRGGCGRPDTRSPTLFQVRNTRDTESLQ